MRSRLVFIFVFLFVVIHSALADEVAKDMSFDKEKAEVSYTLTKPALVRISLGVEDGPIFATLLDWRFRKKGTHKEKWHRTGIKELDNLLCNKKTFFTFNYITSGFDQPGFDLEGLLEEETIVGPIGRASSSISLNYLHKHHKRQFCREPRVNIILPKGTKKTEEGIPIVDKPIILTIELESKDKIWFNRERYSLYVFIDTVFVHGQLEGFSPYHWRFDPKGLNKGMHLIIVNLRGFNDHLGTALLPIYVKS